MYMLFVALCTSRCYLGFPSIIFCDSLILEMRRNQKPSTPKRPTSTRSGNADRLNATAAYRNDTRASMMPPALSETISSDQEQEIDEIEELYGEHLLALAANVVEEKKIQKHEKLITSQLVSLAKQQNTIESKFHEIKMRLRDIQNLNAFQNDFNNQLNSIHNFLEVHGEKISETLTKIYSHLKSLDKLSSKNIIVPNVDEDVNILLDNLEKCSKSLNIIVNSFPESSVDTHSVNNNLKEYKSVINTAEKHLDLSHECLEELRHNVLKTFSLLLRNLNVIKLMDD